jgi:hypothetical protein
VNEAFGRQTIYTVNSSFKSCNQSSQALCAG